MTIQAGGKEFKTKTSLTNYCKYVTKQCNSKHCATR